MNGKENHGFFGGPSNAGNGSHQTRGQPGQIFGRNREQQPQSSQEPEPNDFWANAFGGPSNAGNGGPRVRQQPEQIFGIHREQRPHGSQEPEPNENAHLMFEKRTKLAKCSGKKSAYMLWQYKVGLKQFFDKFGVKFNTHNQEHHANMGQFWMQLTDEEKQAYKQQAKNENSDLEAVQRRRLIGNQRRRQLNHDNARAHYEQQTNHVFELQRRQERFRELRGMAYLPRIENAWNRLPFFKSHIEAKRVKDREHINNILAFRTLNGTVNPMMEGKNTCCQIISVFPITFVYQVNHKAVFTYPAEISIVTFSLKDGLISRATAFVAFDQDAFYNGNANDQNEEYTRDGATRKAYSKTLGIPESGPIAAMGPEDAHKWVMSNLVSGSFRMCDLKQYTWVAYGLRTLAMLSGMQAQVEFQNQISEKLLTIQDFVFVLLDKLPTALGTKMTMGDVENEFLNNYLLPRNDFCNFHKSVPDISCRYQCCEAHNARLIHVAFDLFAYHKLAEFRMTPNHKFCNELQLPIAKLPMAPSIEDEEEEDGWNRLPSTSSQGPSTSTSSAIVSRPAVTYGAPVEDLHPLFTDVHRRVPIEFCREMLNIYSDDSDSDEDADTFNENYSLAREIPSALSASSGFPNIDFRRESSQNNYYRDNDIENTPYFAPGPSTSGPSTSGPSTSNSNPEVYPIRERILNSRPALNETRYLYPPRDRPTLRIEVLNSKDSSEFYCSTAKHAFREAEYNKYHPAVRPNVGFGDDDEDYWE